LADPTGARDAAASPPSPAVTSAPAAEPPAHAHLADLPHPVEPQHRIAPARRPVRWGRGGLVLAVLMVAVLIAALAVNAPGRYLTSTVLAYVADGLSVVALVLGIVGIAANRGRGAGIAAVVLAVLGNPLVLLYGLGALT
jgi:hypothetical protein